MTPQERAEALLTFLSEGEQTQMWFGSRLLKVKINHEMRNGQHQWTVNFPDGNLQLLVRQASNRGLNVTHDQYPVATFELATVDIPPGSSTAVLRTSLTLDEFGPSPPSEVVHRLVEKVALLFPGSVSNGRLELGRFHGNVGWLGGGARVRHQFLCFVLWKMALLGTLPPTLKDCATYTASSTTDEISTNGSGSSPSIDAPAPAAQFRTMPSFVGRAEEYGKQVLALLRDLESQPVSEEHLARLLADRLEDKRHAQNLSTILRRLEMIAQSDRQWRITPQGHALLTAPDPGTALYELLRGKYVGFDDVLAALSSEAGVTSTGVAPALEASLKGWRGTALQHQALRRLNWLVGCGLAERRDNLYYLGPAGLQRLVEQATRQSKVPPADVSANDTVLLGKPRVDLVLVNRILDESDLLFPPSLIEHAVTALQAGKHLLLLGNPGTGKSELARILARAAQLDLQRQGREDDGYTDHPLIATATADWTPYDIVGGWAPRGDGRLGFREGIVTRALLERRWVVLDELNRADIDKCFGELFTILSTPSATVRTPFSDDDGNPVELGPGSPRYRVGPWFRIIATMNMRDKASLFRMSYALLRRFAVLVVPPLDDETMRTLARRRAKRLGLADDVAMFVARCLSRDGGLGQTTSLGASFLCDILDYVAAGRAEAGDREGDTLRMRRLVAEALVCFILPQLNISQDDAGSVKHSLNIFFSGDASLQMFLSAQVDGLLAG